VNKNLPSRCWFGRIWLYVQVWLRRILKNTRNIHGFHKRSCTAPTYNLLQPKYSQTLMLYEWRHPFKVLVWLDLTLCTSVASSNIEKYAKYPRFSQTISHCTDIQPPTTKIFSNTYVIWIQTSLQGVGLVGFGFVYKCGFVEYWKKREISTSASENVDFIGSTVDFDINKIFTIRQR
jgi:hypothetical protein